MREKWDRLRFFEASELLSQATPVEWHKQFPNIFMWHSLVTWNVPHIDWTVTSASIILNNTLVMKWNDWGKKKSSSPNCLKYQPYCHCCCRSHPSECSWEVLLCLEKREQLKYFPEDLTPAAAGRSSKDLTCHVGLCNSTRGCLTSVKSIVSNSYRAILNRAALWCCSKAWGVINISLSKMLSVHSELSGLVYVWTVY